MGVNPQIDLPVQIIDDVTDVNAASVMPNFDALRNAHNVHTHTDFATQNYVDTQITNALASAEDDAIVFSVALSPW